FSFFLPGRPRPHPRLVRSRPDGDAACPGRESELPARRLDSITSEADKVEAAESVVGARFEHRPAEGVLLAGDDVAHPVDTGAELARVRGVEGHVELDVEQVLTDAARLAHQMFERFGAAGARRCLATHELV